MQSSTRGQASFPAIPFLNVQTDDKKKKVHHEALSEVLKIFRNAGMTHYNVSHIDDPQRDKNLPIKIGKHIFDLSFPKDKNTIVLLEVKILKLPKPPPREPDNGNRNP